MAAHGREPRRDGSRPTTPTRSNQPASSGDRLAPSRLARSPEDSRRRDTARLKQPWTAGIAGLVPALALAHPAGLGELADRYLGLPRGAGVAAGPGRALVAGMLAGADSITDMGLLRHGGIDRLFTGVPALSTLGTFLRSFRFRQVRQLDAVAARFLANLAQRAPVVTAGEPSLTSTSTTRSARTTAMPSGTPAAATRA